MGLSIVCPSCDARPPEWVPHHGRWRWMSCHIMSKHRNGAGRTIDGGQLQVVRKALKQPE
jgi:hypothetical protein